MWFEEGSPFLAQLSAELGGILLKFKLLLWTGENSVYVRDEVARTLRKNYPLNTLSFRGPAI